MEVNSSHFLFKIMIGVSFCIRLMFLWLTLSMTLCTTTWSSLGKPWAKANGRSRIKPDDWSKLGRRTRYSLSFSSGISNVREARLFLSRGTSVAP
ncbi:hypothetical protein BD769DRAFT_1433846 [Suillus cothurnatus]|nr:hypothetical protein BD769DRAFT_1433846 [Suillus cothurnatus]